MQGAKGTGSARTGRDGADVKEARAVRVSRADWLLTLGFVALFLVQLAHHQMWRDELNVYGIVLASPNLRALLSYIHYEGHPWLWYVLIWGVSRVTTDPIGMKVLEGFIGAATYLLIGTAPPFNRKEKVLLFLSYFVFFEYSVMSRMYSLMLLLALVYVRRRALELGGFRIKGLVLGSLACTDTTGLILSLGFVAELAWTVTAGNRMESAGSHRREVGGRKALLQGAILYFGLAGISVLSLIPAKDISTRTVGHLFQWALDGGHFFAAVVNYVVVPYIPTMTGQRGSFWDASAGSHEIISVLLLPVVLAAYWLTLRRRENLVVLFGVTLGGMICFAHLVYMGNTRNYGLVFVAFIACLWLMRSYGDRVAWPAYGLLVLSAAAGIDAGVESWMRPFSNAENTAAWLRAHQLGAKPWVGTPDTSVAGIAELSHRSIYMLDCDCSDTFLLFSKRRDGFSIAQIPDRLVVARRNLRVNDFVYIGTVAFTPEQEQQIQARGFSVRKLTRFTGADAQEEDFYIYQLTYGRGE